MSEFAACSQNFVDYTNSLKALAEKCPGSKITWTGYDHNGLQRNFEAEIEAIILSGGIFFSIKLKIKNEINGNGKMPRTLPCFSKISIPDNLQEAKEINIPELWATVKFP